MPGPSTTPTLLQTSPYLEVCYAEDKGRFLIAKQDIPKDTLVFSTTAYATNILESFKKRICFVCLKFNEKGRYELHCRECAQFYFCSAPCRDKFMDTHQDECNTLRKLACSRYGLHVESVLQLAVFILKRRTIELTSPTAPSTQQPVETTISSTTTSSPSNGTPTPAPAPAPATSTTSADDIHSQNEMRILPTYADVDMLVEHYQEIPKHDADFYKKGIQLLKMTLTGKLYECNKELLNSEETMLRLVSKIESNGFGVWKETTCMGRAIHPLASYFNHSCDPNCQTKQKEGCLYIQTLVSVKKGDELCISYIDSNLPRCNRQQALYRDYYFSCCCLRCEREKLDPPKAHKFKYSKSVNNSMKGKKGEEKREQKRLEKLKLKNLSLNNSHPITQPPANNPASAESAGANEADAATTSATTTNAVESIAAGAIANGTTQ